MLRYALIGLLLLHGLIHLIGFAKAFGYGNITQLRAPITPFFGLLWLFTTLLFVSSAGMQLVRSDFWWIPASGAVLLSQILIFGLWQDARFGTVANVLIGLAVVAAFGAWRFECRYRQDVEANLARGARESSLLTEAGIRHLPAPVQAYLRYTGVLGKAKAQNMRVVFKGQMRGKGKDWFNFESEQYDFFDVPTRLFFMKGRMFGLTVPGYHAYKNGRASMQIRLFGLIPVVNFSGEMLDKAETVTLFNDICLMSPSTLADPGIHWDSIDAHSARAVYTVGGTSISALLRFADDGRLLDFISDDRIEINEGKQYRFSTPVHDYRMFPGGYNLACDGDAVWHYPEGSFVYGKFWMTEIGYDVRE